MYVGKSASIRNVLFKSLHNKNETNLARVPPFVHIWSSVVQALLCL